MNYPHLFSPGAIGTLELKNRLISLSMSKNYGTLDGRVTQRYIDYVEARARGGVGLIFLESTYLHPMMKARRLQLGLYDDRLIPGLRRLTDAIHANGAKAAFQINALGRQGSAAVSGFQPVAPSAVPSMATGGDMPRVLGIDEIHAWVERFGEGARRAKEAGFDLVEIHGGNGYLVTQFLSPYSNRRTDAYGGSLDNRLRFPLEVIAAVRGAVGDDFPLSMRFCADEFIDGGLTLDDTRPIAARMAEAGIDMLNVSGGIYDGRMSSTIPMGGTPGQLAYLAEEIKREVDIPVATAGKITYPELAEELLRAGKADFIGVARPLHADPEFARKASEGRDELIRPCITCNRCIEDLAAGAPMRCLINPSAGRERELAVAPCAATRGVLVIGGGPAGLEAACVAAQRGCRVTLFEKAAELGGHLRLLRQLPRNAEYAELLRFYAAQLNHLGVEVRLNEEASIQSVARLHPDAVIVAAGARPFVPPIPGAEMDHVRTAWDLIVERTRPALEAGQHAAIVGGGSLACLVAEWLADEGPRVTLCDPAKELAADITAPKRRQALISRLEGHERIELRRQTTVEEIRPRSIIIQSRGEISECNSLDAVVVASLGAETTLLDALKADPPAATLLAAGDCVWTRDAFEAISDGAAAARALP